MQRLQKTQSPIPDSTRVSSPKEMLLKRADARNISRHEMPLCPVGNLNGYKPRGERSIRAPLL